MVFAFDPRKLVEEDQENKKKEVKEAVDSVLTLKEKTEKNEAFIRKQSNISDSGGRCSASWRSYASPGRPAPSGGRCSACWLRGTRRWLRASPASEGS